ncbi:hypothetical protein AK88_05091 [Plasmodium fragile]|uniref:Serine/threonine-protein phosphatase n=1 Tax=Plasmodium fragile TaxID=5857 RepID=A0A0D9QDZ9_PLAFR|nr:uncharacterized protein AK88_05091 [Plasmodium fragile]KJP85280.1 hypothetical protein AK88_05091 [Plasmodium fragile]
MLKLQTHEMEKEGTNDLPTFSEAPEISSKIYDHILELDCRTEAGNSVRSRGKYTEATARGEVQQDKEAYRSSHKVNGKAPSNKNDRVGEEQSMGETQDNHIVLSNHNWCELRMAARRGSMQDLIKDTHKNALEHKQTNFLCLEEILKKMDLMLQLQMKMSQSVASHREERQLFFQHLYELKKQVADKAFNSLCNKDLARRYVESNQAKQKKEITLFNTEPTYMELQREKYNPTQGCDVATKGTKNTRLFFFHLNELEECVYSFTHFCREMSTQICPPREEGGYTYSDSLEQRFFSFLRNPQAMQLIRGLEKNLTKIKSIRGGPTKRDEPFCHIFSNNYINFQKPLSLELLYPNGTDEPPDYKALRDHLRKEGRIRKEDCLDIIKKVIDIVSNEPNLLRLQDPITIVGDIHGQYYDFLKLLEVGGNPETTQFLFLGDYVDRGSFSIEVLLLLYALKINFPNKIWLIRGNHECRQMTSFFNFRDECEYKYDMVVYYAFMESFDTIPLSAVINGKFLAVHGGLSPQLVLLNQICSFTRFQEPPRSGIFCDILWSDPIDEDKEEHTIQTESYFPNDIRGCSYFFGYNAATTFLEKNGLLSIIRAHEAQLEGYKMHQTNLKTGFPIVITIFSAPNYCDVYNNKGAVLKFDSNTLNIQQFSFSPHPYHLPNFMNLFTWSLPFVSEKVTEMLYSILNSSVNQSDEGVKDVVLPPEVLQIINYIEENNMKLDELSVRNGVAATHHTVHDEGNSIEQGADTPSSPQAKEEALFKDGCFNEGAPKNGQLSGRSAHVAAAATAASASLAGSTQQMGSQAEQAAQRLHNEDAQASKERSDALRKKVQSVGRLMRVFRTLRKENELIVQLKGCSPGYRIPVGLLLQGKEGLENELEKFTKAKQIDSINEKRPPNEKEGRIRKEDCLDIIKKVIDIVSNEPNLLRLQDPITIVGDIHGQYYDFLKLLEVGGNPETTQFLFLGDYVDRGSFSIEVLLLLYALKINFPNKIWLIRGNHECRQMTSFFNFRDECEYKYDMVVYYAFMESFDTIPLSAVINGKFLAVHGGLSPQLVLLNQICSFTRFQEPPRSGIFCDILWSDPIDEDKEEHTIQTESYFPNDIRGCSYFFGYNAATTFLEKNGLLSIIRAHEAQLEGYKMHQTNLKTGFPIVITIFSAPNYCDVYNNKGAVLKFDSNTLNIQQFSFSPHPYHLPNFMNLFTWSLPFVSEKVTEMLYSILNSSVNQSDEGVKDVVLPPEVLQIINYIEENNMKLDELSVRNGVAATHHTVHDEGNSIEQGADTPSSPQAKEEALFKDGCFNEGAPKNGQLSGRSAHVAAAATAASASLAGSTQQMGSQAEQAAQRLHNEDAQASKERSDALRKKVQSVGRLMRVFRTLRKENELIVQLKGCSPGYRIPVGLLLQGKEGLENELEKFTKAKQIDSINEKRPPNE